MGLNMTHGCFDGSYSSFNNFRDKIAVLAGYTEIEVQEPYYHKTINIDWNSITEKNLLGKWKDVPKDPLIILIAHYDCEGILNKKYNSKLLIRLMEIYESTVNYRNEDEQFLNKFKTFIDGLTLAVNHYEDVEFH